MGDIFCAEKARGPKEVARCAKVLETSAAPILKVWQRDLSNASPEFGRTNPILQMIFSFFIQTISSAV